MSDTVMAHIVIVAIVVIVIRGRERKSLGS